MTPERVLAIQTEVDEAEHDEWGTAVVLELLTAIREARAENERLKTELKEFREWDNAEDDCYDPVHLALKQQLDMLQAENYWSLIEHFQELIPPGGTIGREEVLAYLESRAVHRPQYSLREQQLANPQALVVEKS